MNWIRHDLSTAFETGLSALGLFCIVPTRSPWVLWITKHISFLLVNVKLLKINLAYLPALIWQCFPSYKKGYLGTLICHIFDISTVIFIMEVSKCNVFLKLLSPFQGPNRNAALLPQSHKTSKYHQWLLHAKFLLKGAQSRYFELFWASTKLPLNWRKPENNTLQR